MGKRKVLTKLQEGEGRMGCRKPNLSGKVLRGPWRLRCNPPASCDGTVRRPHPWRFLWHRSPKRVQAGWFISSNSAFCSIHLLLHSLALALRKSLGNTLKGRWVLMNLGLGILLAYSSEWNKKRLTVSSLKGTSGPGINQISASNSTQQTIFRWSTLVEPLLSTGSTRFISFPWHFLYSWSSSTFKRTWWAATSWQHKRYNNNPFIKFLFLSSWFQGCRVKINELSSNSNTISFKLLFYKRDTSVEITIRQEKYALVVFVPFANSSCWSSEIHRADSSRNE